MKASDLMEELRYADPDDEVVVINREFEYKVKEISAENNRFYLEIDD